jgi:DNA-binding MarR family transcriptional regulator
MRQAPAIDKLLSVLEVFRKIDRDMPLQQVVLFLAAVRNEGMTLTEICRKFDLAQSTASRNLAILAGLDKRYPNLKALVRLYENPMHRSSKVIEATPEGRVVLNSILRTLGESA